MKAGSNLLDPMIFKGKDPCSDSEVQRVALSQKKQVHTRNLFMFWRLTLNWMEGLTENWLKLEQIDQKIYLEIGSIQRTLFGRFFLIVSRQIWGVCLENQKKIDEK